MYFVRHSILNKISSFLEIGEGTKTINQAQILSALKICPDKGLNIEYTFRPEGKVNQNDGVSFKASELVSRFPTDDIVESVAQNSENSINFKVSLKKVLEENLNVVYSNPNNFWQSSPLLREIHRQHIIVEFSSPNIAKPFHLGNLKSTVIGNFLSRLLEAVGHQVMRLNYLGDWGTQFGLLKYGFDVHKMSESDLETDAIKKLCDLYVWANGEAEKSPEVMEKSKYIFNQMENGDADSLKTWQLCRTLSIKELNEAYKKFCINFDQFHGESMYSKETCNNVINLMTSKGLLEHLSDGRKVYKPSGSDKIVTVIKSDGSTLYITRDIAAAIHRHSMYKFDKMYYVVDSSQTEHFRALFNILKDLDYDWSENLSHIGFGRISGMSTRRGTAVTLQQIIDEGVRVFLSMKDRDKDTPKDEDFDRLQNAEKLVVTAIVMSSLRHKRKSHTVFKWEDVFEVKSGYNLQYLHCRLLRLEENSGVDFNSEINLDCLEEPAVINLIRCIARFDEVLVSTYHCLEPSYLYDYLCLLSAATTTAYKRLPVKNIPLPVAEARLKLFRAARHVLAAGMRIYGIEPLDRL